MTDHKQSKQGNLDLEKKRKTEIYTTNYIKTTQSLHANKQKAN